MLEFSGDDFTEITPVTFPYVKKYFNIRSNELLKNTNHSYHFHGSISILDLVLG